MGNTVDRPVGPGPDTKELEFISALHQSEQIFRKDGSIKAIDIVHYLSSRYGIITSVEEVSDLILKGLGGGDTENDDSIDLAEALAILLIPFFLKATNVINQIDNLDDNATVYSQNVNAGIIFPEMPNVLEDAMKIILKDVCFEGSSELNVPLPPIVDRDLIVKILSFYGEENLAQNEELIQEMILTASNGCEGAVLDANTFGHALTADVLKYNIENESKLTSNYSDVFDEELTYPPSEPVSADSNDLSIFPPIKKDNLGHDDDNDDYNIEESNNEKIIPLIDEKNANNFNRSVKRVYTAPQIDYTADTYRSKFFTVLLWTFFTMMALAYFPSDPVNSEDLLHCTYSDDGGDDNKTEFIGCKFDNKTMCEDNDGDEKIVSFGCKVGNYTLSWLLNAFILSVGGSLIIFVGSLGNNVYHHSKKRLIFSACCMTIFAILPYMLNFPKKKEPFYLRVVRLIALCLGIFLVLVQLFQLIALNRSEKGRENLVRYAINKSSSSRMKNLLSRRVEAFLVHGNVVSEKKMKMAGAHKINLMVKNARSLHTLNSEAGGNNDGSVKTSFYDQALLRFDRGDGVSLESCELRLWDIFAGDVLEIEGLWLSSRIIVGNITQIIASIFVPIISVYYNMYIVEQLKNKGGNEKASSYISTYDVDEEQIKSLSLIRTG